LTLQKLKTEIFDTIEWKSPSLKIVNFFKIKLLDSSELNERKVDLDEDFEGTRVPRAIN